MHHVRALAHPARRAAPHEALAGGAPAKTPSEGKDCPAAAATETMFDGDVAARSTPEPYRTLSGARHEATKLGVCESTGTSACCGGAALALYTLDRGREPQRRVLGRRSLESERRRVGLARLGLAGRGLAVSVGVEADERVSLL